MPDIAAVIMAAGKGTRMKSSIPKVMHLLAGKPLIDHVLNCVQEVDIKKVLVVLGHGREVVEEHLAGRAEFVFQQEQKGTGDAVLKALPFLEGIEDVLIMSGDQPLLAGTTVQEMLKLHRGRGAVATVLTAVLDDPAGLGRIIRDREYLADIVEEKDATEEQRMLKEINTGTYCFNVRALAAALRQVTPQNAQGEYYLTDVFKYFLADGKRVVTYCTSDPHEALGINWRGQLAEAEKIVRRRIRNEWMAAGVTMLDPDSIFIDADVKLEQDVTIFPFTHLQGNTKIGTGSVIGPHTQLDSCSCGKDCQITHTVARDAEIGNSCMVGPFAYLRPGTVLADRVKVGDFVEVKNSKVDVGSKIPHLSYIGDSQIGSSVNIGAGTITCNYDGKQKHRTKIGDRAFIGSNTNLVAPVEVGEDALIGAGSTITKNVPAGALAIERAQQVVKKRKGSPKE